MRLPHQRRQPNNAQGCPSSDKLPVLISCSTMTNKRNTTTIGPTSSPRLSRLLANRDAHCSKGRVEEVEALKEWKRRAPAAHKLFSTRRKFRYGWPIKMTNKERWAGLQHLDVRRSAVNEIFERLTCGFHFRSQRRFLVGDIAPSPGEWKLSKVPRQVLQVEDPIRSFYWNLYPEPPGSLLTLENLVDHILRRGSWFGYRPDTHLLYDGYELVLAGDPAELWVVRNGRAVLAEEVDLPVCPEGTTMTKVLVIDLDLDFGTTNWTRTHKEMGVQQSDPYYGLVTRFLRVEQVLSGGIWLRSSYSGGLHGYYVFPKPVDAEQIYRRAEELLWTMGLEIEAGWVEVFPNPGGGLVRLPLGFGSELLSSDTLKPSYRAEASEQVEGFLAQLRSQKLPEVLGLPPVQQTPGACRKWEWDEALAVDIRRSQASPPEVEEDMSSEQQAGAGMAPVQYHDSETPKLILPGEGSWNDRHAICFRAATALKTLGVTELDEPARALFQNWIVDQRNRSLSKSLSCEQQRDTRIRDLNKTLEWCWPRSRPPGCGAASELTDDDRRWVEMTAERYLGNFPGAPGPKTVRALETVLSEVIGKARASKGPIALGKTFWTFRDDRKQRLNRRSAPDNPLYYVRVRDWLVEQGHLQKLAPGIRGSHGTTYTFTRRRRK